MGAISEVENALFIELKTSKRVIHHKNPKLLARSLVDSLPDSQPADEFNLQTYLDILTKEMDESDTYELA